MLPAGKERKEAASSGTEGANPFVRPPHDTSIPQQSPFTPSLKSLPRRHPDFRISCTSLLFIASCQSVSIARPDAFYRCPPLAVAT